MALRPEEKVKLEEEMNKRKAFDILQRHRMQMDEQNKYSHFNRYMFNQKKELEEEEKNKNVSSANLAQKERDERLAFEMNKMKMQEISDFKKRQIIRESPELRDLESKLKAAYNKKVLLAQIEEKQAQKLREKWKEKEEYAVLQEARRVEKEYYTVQKQETMIQKNKYKKELQDQMIFLEQTKRFQYDEFLREKKFLDELVQRIYDEDIRVQQIKVCNMMRTQEEVKAFQMAQNLWKAKTRQKIEDEDKKIQEYIKLKLDEQKKKQLSIAHENEIKEKICDDMAKKIYSQKRKKEEQQQIILELNEEEQKAEFDRKVKEKMEKDFRARIDVLGVLRWQMQERKENARKQAEEDEAYKKQLIAKIQEDERLELLSKEKKRIKMQQMKLDIEQTIKDQRMQKAMEMQAGIQLFEDEKKQVEERMKLIEQERIKMLQEHAKNLIGFLPPGVLKDDDLQYLEPDVVQKMRCNQ